MIPPYDGTQACAQTDSEIFFPNNVLIDKNTIRVALSICKGCHLLKACREYAESQTDLYGIWGGKWYGHNNLPIADLERKVA